jgi:hypothetical protein
VSLESADREAAAVAIAPRVSLADIEAAIDGVYYITGLNAADFGESAPVSPQHQG